MKNLSHFNRIFLKILLCFSIITSLSSQQIKNQQKFVVVIDAGHGGKDSGAVGVNRVLENNSKKQIISKNGKLLNNGSHTCFNTREKRLNGP